MSKTKKEAQTFEAWLRKSGSCHPGSLDLRLNNCGTNDPCAFCGERTDPVVGWEIFASGTYALVCDSCSEQVAPELLVVRDLANAVCTNLPCTPKPPRKSIREAFADAEAHAYEILGNYHLRKEFEMYSKQRKVVKGGAR
jgi:hypothetical protein